jgi:hypothetical protein
MERRSNDGCYDSIKNNKNGTFEVYGKDDPPKGRKGKRRG